MVSEREAVIAPTPRSITIGTVEAPRTAGPIPQAIAHVSRICELIAGGVAALALLVFVGVVLSRVIGRDAFNQALGWVTTVSTLCLEIITFCGGAIAFRRGDLASFEALTRRMKRWSSNADNGTLDAIRYPLVIAIAGLTFVASITNLTQQSLSQSRNLNLSGSWYALPLTVGMGLICIFAFDVMASRFRLRINAKAVAIAIVMVAAVLAIAAATSRGSTTSFIVTVFTVVLGLGLGVPVAFALAGGSAVFLVKTHFAALTALAQGMQFGVTNFLLLAIPAFLLAGLIIARTGLVRRITDLTYLLVRRLPGRLLHVAIGGMYIFSGISGSKLADVAAVGGALKEDLEAEGHPPGETSAVLSAAAVMGEAVPPSIPLLVLASIVPSLSPGKLLVSGIGPAAVVGMCLSAFILVQYMRRRDVKEVFGVSEVKAAADEAERGAKVWLATIWRSLPALAVPVVLVGGIVGGFATPSEVSCVAVAIALIAALVSAQRRPGISDLVGILIRTISLSGMVLLIVASAESFSFVFAASRVNTVITNELSHLPDGVVFMLVSVLALVLLGTILEGIAAVILFGPLLVPVAVTLGVNEYQYGILLILATGLGAFLPPLGVGVYGTCGVVGATIEETSKPLAKYALVILAGLLVVIFIPVITTGLGNAGL